MEAVHVLAVDISPGEAVARYRGFRCWRKTTRWPLRSWLGSLQMFRALGSCAPTAASGAPTACTGEGKYGWVHPIVWLSCCRESDFVGVIAATESLALWF